MANPTEAAARAEILAVNPSAVFAPTTTAYSSSVAAGLVISIVPPVDQLVVPDQPITLVLSLGPFPASRWAQVGIAAPENLQAAVEAPVTAIRLATLVFLDIPGDPIYVTDANMNLNWAGQEWIDRGMYGSMEGPSESLDVITHPLKLTLAGVDLSDVPLLSDALNSQYHGRDAIVYIALLDPHTYAFIESPITLWSGFIDVMTIETDKNSATIHIDCEHELRRLATPKRWTDEAHRARFSGDRFFEFLNEILGYVAGAGGGAITYAGPGRNRERPNRRPD